MRIGSLFNVRCSNIATRAGHEITWHSEITSVCISLQLESTDVLTATPNSLFMDHLLYGIEACPVNFDNLDLSFAGVRVGAVWARTLL